MPLGGGGGDALTVAADIWKTVGFTLDENQQPVKNPTEDEVNKLIAYLTEALTSLKALKKEKKG